MTHDQPANELTKAFLADCAAGTKRFTRRTFEHLRVAQEELTGLTFEECTFLDCVFAQAKLDGCLFRKCSFREINGIHASLIGAVFEQCDIAQAAFGRADFYRAKFTNCTTRANFHDTFFVQAEFAHSKVIGCTFARAHFGFTRFEDTVLILTDFDDFKLAGTNTFDESTISGTYVETRRILERLVDQSGPGEPTQALIRDAATVTRFFLASGAAPELVRTATEGTDLAPTPSRPSVFISYSSQDEQFATSLHEMLRLYGVDTWFAPHDIKGGRTILEQITTEIHNRTKVILVLSEASMASNWVATEIMRTRQAEEQAGKRKLFPIRIVDFDKLRAWELFDADEGYDIARKIREYFVPDFSQAAHDDLQFGQAVTRLVQELRD